MKKLIKATALLLAVTVALTACRNENSAGNLKKEYKAYMNAEVTEVEDKPFTLNGAKGYYSGDWKGNRPEGEGTLWLSDDEYYYSENWSNGNINGQGEIRRIDSDGNVRFYTGECAYSEPSGQGTLEIGEDGDEYRTVIDGDFAKPSELLYYTLDENGGCVDVGGFITGEFESYVENSGVTGREWLADRTPIGATYKSRSGHYIGQVNEKGIPDGYGYYSEVYELNPGIIEQLTSCTYVAIGSWKNGKLEGYFTDVLIGKGTITRSETGFMGGRKETKYNVINSTKQVGCTKNNKLVGNYSISTTIESDPPRPNEDGIKKTTMNFDTCDKMVEEFYPDNTRTCTWTHMISEIIADEGEFIKYDKDGNMTIHKTMSDGRWTELMDLEREQREARDRLIEKGASIAVLVGFIAGAYAIERSAMKDFDNSSAGKWLADIRRSNAIADKNREFKYEAERAAKRGDWDEAADLLDKAANAARWI